MIGAFLYPQIINKDLNRRLAKKKQIDGDWQNYYWFQIPMGGSDTVKQKKHKSCSKGVSKMSLVFDDIPHHPLTFT